MEKDDLVCFFHRFEHRFLVEGQQRTQIDNFQVDSFHFQFLRGVQREIEHCAVRHHTNVAAVPAHSRLADRHHEVFGRKLFFHAPVEKLVFEIDDRIRVSNSSLDQPLRIVRRRRAHDLQAGRMNVVHFGILRMEGSAVNAAAARSADHNGHACSPAVSAFRSKVRNLIESAGDKIGKLHFGDRTHSH